MRASISMNVQIATYCSDPEKGIAVCSVRMEVLSVHPNSENYNKLSSIKL